jgi:hypothetical protein
MSSISHTQYIHSGAHSVAGDYLQCLYLAANGCKTYLNLNLDSLTGWQAALFGYCVSLANSDAPDECIAPPARSSRYRMS